MVRTEVRATEYIGHCYEGDSVRYGFETDYLSDHRVVQTVKMDTVCIRYLCCNVEMFELCAIINFSSTGT